jgi:hypothetical protein
MRARSASAAGARLPSITRRISKTAPLDLHREGAGESQRSIVRTVLFFVMELGSEKALELLPTTRFLRRCRLENELAGIIEGYCAGPAGSVMCALLRRTSDRFRQG